MPGNDVARRLCRRTSSCRRRMLVHAAGRPRRLRARRSVGDRRRGDDALPGDPARRVHGRRPRGRHRRRRHRHATRCRSRARSARTSPPSTSTTPGSTRGAARRRLAVQSARGRRAGRSRRQLLAESGVSTARWRIFEMSGTAAGQELAWSLLPPAGTLGVIGFTMDKPSVRLSNLMALDATAFGSWGCSPARYPDGRRSRPAREGARCKPFVEPHPLRRRPALFARGRGARRGRRAILVPCATGTAGDRDMLLKSITGSIDRADYRHIRVERRPARGLRRRRRSRSAQRLDLAQQPVAVEQLHDRALAELILAFREASWTAPSWRSCSPASATARSAPAATRRSTPSTTPAVRRNTGSTCGCSTTWSRGS